MAADHPDALARQLTLLAALRRAEAYPHPVGEIRVIETHISWVLLAGDFAYKIKKALDAGFLDYRRLADRRHFCAEEMRLNPRGAPSIYLGIAPIAGPPERARIDGGGPAIEYAVRMRRFRQAQLLSRVVAEGRFDATLAARLATRIAEFHQALPPLRADLPHGSADATRAATADVAGSLDRLLASPAAADRWPRVRTWVLAAGETLDHAFAVRRRAGAVRECHGDLHCANVVVGEPGIELFDSIEFDAALRCIDVANDLAFLLMDLHAAGQAGIARECLNRYLEITGDYGALAVLRYYLVYRALVRCMVEGLRAAQKPVDEAAACARGEAYLALADRLRTADGGGIILTHGYSGSGKSTVALSLCRHVDAIRIRSDVERTRQFGTGASTARTKYGPQATDAVHARLADLAAAIVAAGWIAVVDATFLRRAQRQRFRDLAGRLGVPFAILDCQAPPEVLRARITQRRSAGGDASEADLAVLAMQLESAEPLTADEASVAEPVDAEAIAGAEDGSAWAGLIARIRRGARSPGS